MQYDSLTRIAMFLCEIKTTHIATVVKRPSQTCKTPYVADAYLELDDPNNIQLVHTACLGCGGLVDADKQIIVKEVDNSKNVCKYRVILAKAIERGRINIIGVDPKMAEDLVEIALKKNYINSLKDIKSYKREKTVLNSRFDYVGIDCNDKEFIMEVKNVPLADYVDCENKYKKHMNFDDREFNSKIAYFPDGYRKSKKDTVSPRALKHITELTNIANDESKDIRTIMCYVVQRRDVSSFQAANIDTIYKSAFTKAIKSGVEVIVLQVGWSEDGIAELITDNLPVNVN